MACESAGVGVKPQARSAITSTSLPASTSSAVANAGSESACVSLAKNSGPSTPPSWRYWQIACVMARIWPSLNEHSKDDPRCPEVPKLTFWEATETSGCSV